MSEGGALSLEQAVAYACRGRASHTRGRSGWESLTPSEQRVVSLVGQHLTNAQIAERLFISEYAYGASKQSVLPLTFHETTLCVYEMNQVGELH